MPGMHTGVRMLHVCDRRTCTCGVWVFIFIVVGAVFFKENGPGIGGQKMDPSFFKTILIGLTRVRFSGFDFGPTAPAFFYAALRKIYHTSLISFRASLVPLRLRAHHGFNHHYSSFKHCDSQEQSRQTDHRTRTMKSLSALVHARYSAKPTSPLVTSKNSSTTGRFTQAIWSLTPKNQLRRLNQAYICAAASARSHETAARPQAAQLTWSLGALLPGDAATCTLSHLYNSARGCACARLQDKPD